jgi:capsule polysaccharide modification protein KpsS
MHVYSNSLTDQINHQELNYWKNSSIDNSILDCFKALELNKYVSGQNVTIDFDSYILLPLQSLDYQFDLKIFVDIVRWSKDNKRLIVLKLHPFTEVTNYIFPILKKLKSARLLDYVKVVTHEYNIDALIEKADKVWTFNSGVALTSIIKGKPTSVFWNCVYSPLCKRCYSPEEADANPYPDDDILYRYLSWFYHRSTIDIGADTASDRFTELFDHFYRDQKSLELYMNIDWK